MHSGRSSSPQIRAAGTRSGSVSTQYSCCQPDPSIRWRKYPWRYMRPTATSGSPMSDASLRMSPASTPRPPEYTGSDLWMAYSAQKKAAGRSSLTGSSSSGSANSAPTAS